MPVSGETVDLDCVELLRVGTYTDKHGREVTFDEPYLKALAENYDPELHEAPGNLDHIDEGGAYGWVASLKYDAGRLLANIAQIPVEFAAQLKAGVYKKRSAEISRKPVAGRAPYLRAFAWLGAKPPAVKGMADFSPVALSDEEGNTVILYEEVSANMLDIKALLALLGEKARQSFKARIIGDGDDAKLEIVPDEPVVKVADAANPQLDELLKTSQAQAALIEQLKADAKTRDTEVSALKVDADRKSVEAEVAALCSEGRVLPAEREELTELLFSMRNSSTTIKLSDGSEVSSYERLLAALKKRPKLAHLMSEVTPADDEGQVQLSEADRKVAEQLGSLDLLSKPAKDKEVKP